MKPQVEKLIVGDAVATDATVKAFIADADDKEIGVYSIDGTAAAAGKDFKIYQKAADGFEFSEIIKADKVNKVTVAEYAPEVQKVMKVSGITGNIESNATYVVNVLIYNAGGSLSVENFDIVSGYHVTGTNTSDTDATIANGLIDSLNANLKLRGDSEVTVALDSTADILITGKAQKVVPGRIEGRQIKFDVTAKVYDNVSMLDEDLGLLDVTTVTESFPGVGTGKYAVNLEWFTKGYDNEVYRDRSYPANFSTPYYTDLKEKYNVIHLFHYDGRDYTTVEKQHKLLTILVETDDDDADNEATNAVLAKLRTILPNAGVPANLDEA